jgi:copper chaperone CopZ
MNASLQRQQFQVDGLDCASEVRVLTERVARVPGTVELKSDVVNGRMTATFEPSAVSAQQFVASVAETGMSAHLVARRVPFGGADTWLKNPARLLGTILLGPC